MATDGAQIAGFATRGSLAMGGAGGKDGSARAPRRHGRSGALYMLPLGVAPPKRAAKVEDQILHSLADLGAATERQVLARIARDWWYIAHKAFLLMVARGEIVPATPGGPQSAMPVEALSGTVLDTRAQSPVSAVAYILPDGDQRPVRVVAFGPRAHRLLGFRPGAAVELGVKWLRRAGRRSAQALAIDERWT